MKASYIESYGGLEVLKVGELPTPKIGEDEVLVRLKAAALNHLDIWVRRGLAGVKLNFPHVLGGDGAGIVESVGKNVKSAKPGDEVIVYPGIVPAGVKPHPCENLTPGYQILGEHVWGTHAEYVKVPKENVFKKPDRLSFEEAASVGLVFTTAYQMVVDKGAVKSGDRVLIHAAASGVSSAAIQIAKHLGAFVIATAGEAHKVELARSLGADHVIRYDEQDFVQEVKRLTRWVDVIIDHVGLKTWEQNIRCLNWGGRLVLCGATSGHEVETDLRHLFYRQLQILGSTMGTKKDFPNILEGLSKGAYRAVIDRVFSLEGMVSAHERLENRMACGKVVVSIP